MKTTLVIMAAGLGSRYGGDKQIDGIGPNGEILMQYSIYDALCAGFQKLVFIIKPEHRAIIERFCEPLCRRFPEVEVAYAYQKFSSLPEFYKVPEGRIKPFGTVHAVLCARNVINEPFAVINADDFYGADAFGVLHTYLTTMKKGQGAMVAYRLKNTVSRNGAVTRGICRTRCGRLTGVTETYKITVDDAGKISDADSGTLDGECLVSMNMWGFNPDIFDGMESDFEEFLRSLSPDEIKAEYALPTMVDRMISEKKISIRVLSTDAVWFGVTYHEDRASVAEELKKMHEAGKYPESLV